MIEVSVIIPNYNGIAFIDTCIQSLNKQTYKNFEVIVIDNASADGSYEKVKTEYPSVRLIRMDQNYGFCKAVNKGIEAAAAPYVILLNNDTEVTGNFVESLLAAIRDDTKIFSCASKMIQYHNHNKMDDGGNLYNVLGWAFARGKDKDIGRYNKRIPVTAACAGAAIYRKKIIEQIGMFDENHFAYLEDIDIGLRARLYGYKNIFIPEAIVYHVGSGTSGSRHNEFKVGLSSRNNIYLIYKNMPLLMLVWNLLPLFLGFFIKYLFFLKKGFGSIYLKGIKRGLTSLPKEKKVKFKWRNIGDYVKIQLELYVNLFRYLCN